MPRGFIATPGPIHTQTFGAGLAHRASHADDLRRRDQRFLLGPGRRAVLELEVPPLDEAEGLLLGEGGLVDRACRRRTGCLPSLKSPTNSRFHSPSVSSTCAIAPASAPSVPGFSGSHSCALAATFDSRGSTAITVPRCEDLARSGGSCSAPRGSTPADRSPRRTRQLVLLEVVVAVAEEALREPRPHLLGLGADRAVREVVGRAEDARQRAVQQVGGGRRIAAAHVDELVRLVVAAQLHHLVGDRVERLVPGDRHPARVDAAALDRVGALQRHLDAVGVVHLLRDQVSARAAVAVVGLRERVAAHAHRAAVLHEDLDRAPLRAALAGRGAPSRPSPARPAWALRGAIAALTGVAPPPVPGVVAQPASTIDAVPADALMKSRRVSFIYRPPGLRAAGAARFVRFPAIASRVCVRIGGIEIRLASVVIDEGQSSR